jgi:chromosome segregation ATPase
MHEVLEGDIELVGSENGKFKEKIDSLEKNLNSEKASFDMLKITHETTKTELANAGIDLTATKKNLASKKEENLKLKSELQKEMTTTASKDKNLRLNSSNLAKIQEKIQKLETDNEQKSLLLKKNETEMQKTQTTLETHQKTSQSDILIIKKLENSVSNFTDIISSLNEELESLTKSNEELSTKLQASQTKTNEQSRELLEQKDQCSKLQTELFEEAEKSSAMLFVINEKDTNEEDLTKKLASIKEHLGIELGKTEYQESRLAELIAKTETDGNEISELSQTLEKSRLFGTEQGIEISRLKTEIDNLGMECEGVGRRLEILEEEKILVDGELTKKVFDLEVATKRCEALERTLKESNQIMKSKHDEVSIQLHELSASKSNLQKTLARASDTSTS